MSFRVTDSTMGFAIPNGGSPFQMEGRRFASPFSYILRVIFLNISRIRGSQTPEPTLTPLVIDYLLLSIHPGPVAFYIRSL